MHGCKIAGSMILPAALAYSRAVLATDSSPVVNSALRAFDKYTVHEIERYSIPIRCSALIINRESVDGSEPHGLR
jgi:hypothetical protein